MVVRSFLECLPRNLEGAIELFRIFRIVFIYKEATFDVQHQVKMVLFPQRLNN